MTREGEVAKWSQAWNQEIAGKPMVPPKFYLKPPVKRLNRIKWKYMFTPKYLANG